MSKSKMNRRSFISATSAAAIGLASGKLFAADRGGAVLPVLSVGYEPPQSRGRSSGRAGGSRLIAAESVMMSEPSLVRTGARLRIGGGLREQGDALAVTVDVLHRVDDLVEKAVFHAWGSQRTSRRLSTSSDARFAVPVDSQDTLDFAVTLSAATGSSRTVVRFTTFSAADAIRLNSGSYVFAVGPIDWSSTYLDNRVLKSTFDRQPLDRDYFVLTVAA